MTAFDLNGIGESSAATDGMTISVTLKTADSGLVTLNMPLALSGHLIRVLSGASREAHARRRKAGQNTDFVSLIAQVKTLTVGGAETHQHPVISIETVPPEPNDRSSVPSSSYRAKARPTPASDL